MECLFKEEIKNGTMCCDYGGLAHGDGVDQCPTFIFNLCQSLDKGHEPIPETLTWCRQHYVPPVKKFITCQKFGNIDGMDGACWWCMEMTPYQWHMCSDESWIRGLLRPTACKRKKSRKEAIEFIEEYKQNHPMGNERRSLQSEKE